MADECETYDDAVEVLSQVHDLGRRRELRKYGYIDLNIRRDGNEYAEIVEDMVIVFEKAL